MEPDVSFQNSQLPAPVHILSQLDPGHTATSYLLKTHLTTIVLSTSGSPHCCLFPMFPQYVQGQSKQIPNICDSAPVRRCMTLATVVLCSGDFKPLNAELNPICHFLLWLGAHPILHISRIRVKLYFDTSHITPISMSHELRGLEWTCV